MEVILRDPDGDLILTGDDAEAKAALYLELAERYDQRVMEVFRMVKLALFGPMAIDDEWYPGREEDEVRRDRHDLEQWGPTGVLTIEQYVGIWERAHYGLLLRAERECDPARKAKLERVLAEREAVMNKLISKRLRREIMHKLNDYRWNRT